MARRFEWVYAEPSRLGGGNWFEAWGDPLHERRVTLTTVVIASDDPIWCVRTHAQVLADMAADATELLDDLDRAFPDEAAAGEAVVTPDSPLGVSLLRAHRALSHAVALLVDALVECRRGRLDVALHGDPDCSGDVVFSLAEAVNLQLWIAHRIRIPDE